MAIIRSRPLTPSQRYTALNRQNVAQKRPERSLTRGGMTKSAGRNCYGRITSRRRGGGHKRLLRFVDFKRDKFDIQAKVQHIEYDPNRSAQIALLAYADGEKRYIIAPNGLKVGDSVQSLNAPPRDFATGMSLPLSLVPLSIPIHCVELLPGRGAQLARTAGSSVQLLAVEGGKATLRLASGEVRYVDARCRATLGSVGNSEHNQQSLGKAGRRRWMGRRPRVRGVAMNPVDHPMGGGEGRTSGGGHPVSPWGQLAKGFLTRRRSKPSNGSILIRRNGRKVKKG
ncbi:MAG: 50S ribosomal protein L2 [Puniceicoccales bacterium]|jgi:large subunit ribosomal protein L2|nr:50S ribosomal protein L2 [Puniceicoccales bacterium]